MINFLMILHSGEEFLAHVAIHPANIEVKVGNRFDDQVPFEFFGDVFDHRILGFWIDGSGYRKR